MIKHILGAAILVATVATTAGATTVDTFSFSQSGYSGSLVPGSSGVLSGNFTGTVDADGFIELADLTSINLQFQFGPETLYGFGPATFFSFLPGSASTLDLQIRIGASGFACVGAVAAFGFQGCGSGGANGEVAGLDTTQSLAAVTLTLQQIISPVAPPPLPQPAPAPTQPMPTAAPEPGSWSILVAGLLALTWLSASRRRFARPRAGQTCSGHGLRPGTSWTSGGDVGAGAGACHVHRRRCVGRP